jgi:hypothetical protein
MGSFLTHRRLVTPTQCTCFLVLNFCVLQLFAHICPFFDTMSSLKAWLGFYMPGSKNADWQREIYSEYEINKS